MNCERYQHDILLADSGELSEQAAKTLSTHLQECAACKAFSVSLCISTQTARQVLSAELPHPSSMVAIRQAAEQHHNKPRVLWFPTSIARVTAIAALFLMVVGITWVTIAPQAQHSGLQIQELSAMVAMVSEAMSEAEPAAPMVDNTETLQAVALQLLDMEGFAVDDLFESDEVSNLLGQPDPTTTQSHRTRELPVQRCG
jgi:anti-sigma factor RsiW